MAGLAKKATRSDKWEVPEVVGRSKVRAHLAAIVRHVETGAKVRVGTSKDRAYSAFVSRAHFDRRYAAKLVPPRDVDIEALRHRWSREREQVENAGQPLRIFKKGIVAAFLVPTTRGLEEKVSRTREVVDAWGAGEVREMKRRVAVLEKTVQGLRAELPTADEFKRFRALSEEMFRAWRRDKGLPEKPPA